jgi:hypothetical protein
MNVPSPSIAYVWTAGEEHALWMWLRHASNHRLFVSYEKLMAICHQVSYYPQRTRWTLEMGSGWNVVRKGRVLTLEWNPNHSKEEDS